ncbi:MAG: hypothetical protein SOZ71_10020 [Clostridium sp.]|nr:hypothetical protein [Clostridium sp.]
MRYSIEGYSQEKLIKYDLDLKDVMLLRYFLDFINSDTMSKIIINNKTFYWLKYQKLQEDLPILGINNRLVLRRRLKKLEEKKILEHYHKLEGGSFSYYALGENFEELLYKKTENKTDSTKKEDRFMKDLKKNTEIDKVVNEYTENKALRDCITEFINFRKCINATITTFSLKRILERLSNLAYSDEDKIKIINNSIINGWRNIFPLKKDNNESIKKFNNFTPRKYDYDLLEKQLLGYV